MLEARTSIDKDYEKDIPLIINTFTMYTKYGAQILAKILENMGYEVYTDKFNYVVGIPHKEYFGPALVAHFDYVKDNIYGFDEDEWKEYKKKKKEGGKGIGYSWYTHSSYLHLDANTKEVGVEVIHDNILNRIANEFNKKIFVEDEVLGKYFMKNKEIIFRGFKLMSTKDDELFQIGGDDRCGVLAILKVLYDTDKRPLVCFFNGEESGLIGVRKAMNNENIVNLLKKHATFFIEIDRRDRRNYVNYLGGIDSEIKEFLNKFGYKEELGSVSDVREITEKTRIQHINISAGYQNAHSHDEVIDYLDLMETYNVILALLDYDLLYAKQFTISNTIEKYYFGGKHYPYA